MQKEKQQCIHKEVLLLADFGTEALISHFVPVKNTEEMGGSG